MKRVIASLFGTVAGLVMLLSFKTHSQSSGTVAAAVTTTGDSGSGSATGTSKSSASSTRVTSTGTKTYTGDAVDTQWGLVQVQVTVSNGKVTTANAVEYPNGNPRDQQINSYALPKLNSEAVSAGSAQIDMVSGATVTSTGYLSSLQSALDKAGV
jgi:uncharacterized protein with FMN-binding domain